MNHPHIVIIYYIKPSPRWITTNVSNYVLIIPDHHVIMNYVLIIPDHHVIIIINNIQQCTNPFILFMNYVYCYYYWYYCYYVYYILLLLHIIAIITKNNNYYYYYYFYLLATPLLGMQNDPRLVGWFVALGLPEKRPAPNWEGLQTSHQAFTLDFIPLLVGGIPTPLKNMSSSVGMMKFPTEWENKKCSKPSTRLALCTCFQPELWVLKYFPKRYLATSYALSANTMNHFPLTQKPLGLLHTISSPPVK